MRQLEGEKIIQEIRPHKNIAIIWSLRYCLYVLFIFIIAGIPIATGTNIKVVITTGLIFFLLILGAILLAVFLHKTYVYYITDKRCIFEGGILRRISHAVSYEKITDVEVSQNILERILSISTLSIHTAGYGGTDKAELEFVGLSDAETSEATISRLLKRSQEAVKLSEQ